MTIVLAGLTPWLFELGRIAIEASTQPLILVLLLLALHHASRTHAYRVTDGILAGVLLGLLTYSYTGSRLLGPLLAAALVVFGGTGRWRFVLSAWATFALALVPMGVFALRHPGALTSRYEATTIARDGLSGVRLVLQAIANWFHDIDPWHWATAGDPAPYIHDGGYGALFLAVVALAMAGVVIVVREHRASPWWRFVILATLLAPIPPALTVDRFNAIRLVALPVLLLVLAIPALDALASAARESRPARIAAGVLALSVAIQFVDFLDAYRSRGPGRVVLFEAGVAPLLAQPFAAGETIYLDYDDRGAHAEARWHAAAAGVPQGACRDPSGRRDPTRGLACLPPLPGLRLSVRRDGPLGGLPPRTRDAVATSSRAAYRSAASRRVRSSGRGSRRTSGSSGAHRPPTTPSAPSRSRA